MLHLETEMFIFSTYLSPSHKKLDWRFSPNSKDVGLYHDPEVEVEFWVMIKHDERWLHVLK